tara:strand:- start:542 stop:880 length:339 start_codon:yes stop_codon:yes gene_type:complete
MQPNLDITPSASDKIYQLMQEEDNLQLKLRIYITGGGCHGFQYGFAFEEDLKNDDIQIQPAAKAVRVIIDPISLQYLAGSTVDYVCDAAGERFVIKNPNAKTTCGCDKSFST